MKDWWWILAALVVGLAIYVWAPGVFLWFIRGLTWDRGLSSP